MHSLLQGANTLKEWFASMFFVKKKEQMLPMNIEDVW